METLAIFCKEIILKDLGDSFQKIRIHVFLLEQLVDMFPRAAQGIGKARHADSAFLHHFPNPIAYVHHACPMT